MAKQRLWMWPVVALWLGGHMAAAQEADMVTGASPVPPPHVTEMMTRWQDELGLSIEQQAVIADIMRDYGPRMRELAKLGLAAGWSVMEVAPRDPEYTIDTDRASQAAAEAAAEFVRTASEMRSALYSVMTEEQIATLERLVQEGRDHWQKSAEPAADEDSAPATE